MKKIFMLFLMCSLATCSNTECDWVRKTIFHLKLIVNELETNKKLYGHYPAYSTSEFNLHYNDIYIKKMDYIVTNKGYRIRGIVNHHDRNGDVPVFLINQNGIYWGKSATLTQNLDEIDWKQLRSIVRINHNSTSEGDILSFTKIVIGKDCQPEEDN